MFRHRYTSANITLKCNLKLTEVRWSSGNQFTVSTCMNRIYDTIENVSNNRTVFYSFCANAKSGKRSILVWLCKMAKIFKRDSCASCWRLEWEIPYTSICTVFCSALERIESLSLPISRVLIDSFLFSVNSFKILISGDAVLAGRKEV